MQRFPFVGVYGAFSSCSSLLTRRLRETYSKIVQFGDFREFQKSLTLLVFDQKTGGPYKELWYGVGVTNQV